MNPEIETKVLESLDSILSYMEKGADFAVEQAPLVVQELVAWSIWNHAIGVVVDLGAAVVLGFFAKWLLTKAAAESREEIPEQCIEIIFVGGIGGIAAAIATIISVLMAVSEVRMLVMAQVAPRVFVIEKLKELMQ